MKPRTAYSIRKNGRHFTRKALERYRRDLCIELRKQGKAKLAESYEKMSLVKFAANGRYVIVER